MDEQMTKAAGLEAAVEATRPRPGEAGRLSSRARSDVFSSIRSRRRLPGRLSALFVPVRTIVVSCAIPVVGALAVLTVVLSPPRISEPGGPISSLRAEKRGEEVVFIIENGGGTHRVVKSSRADGAGGESSETRGVFRDALRNDANLVFYRVE